MSSFVCEHCGTAILDSPSGYTTSCPHYPQDLLAVFVLDEVVFLGRELAEPPHVVLKDYPAGTACIWYRDGSGKVKDWFIGARPGVDNEKTLRDHLARHLPAAEFIAYAIK